MLKTRIGAALWHTVRHCFCRHPELMRRHIDGVWYFVCVCGYQTPVVRRSPGEERALGRRI